MRFAFIFLALFFTACGDGSNSADSNMTQCIDGGTAVSIRIDSNPYFSYAREYDQGIPLSHTIFYGTDTSTNTSYQVSVDNVFAHDFDANSTTMPQSYQNSIQVGKTAKLCGLTYTNPTGIHWVHTNCGVASSGPTGYMIIDGVNYTNATTYCYLWSN
jgi:hypothetical protein